MEDIAVTKKAPRGRPRAFDVEAALDVAERLFHAKGYDALGVAEIGEAMGINPPSLYAAFGSKAGLFARAAERYEARNAAVLTQALAQEGPAAYALGAMLAAAARLYTREQGCGGCLTLEAVRTHSDPHVRALAEAARDGLRDAIEARIAQEKPGSARRIADMAIIALTGMSSSAREGADEAHLRGFAVLFAEGARKDLARWP